MTNIVTGRSIQRDSRYQGNSEAFVIFGLRRMLEDARLSYVGHHDVPADCRWLW